MRLRHYFFDFISYGLTIDGSFERPGQTPPYSEVLAELSRLLAQAEDAATRAGYLPREVELAALAVAAWIDERLARHSMWRAGTPLQTRRFGTHTAGNRFYINLEELLPDADELREVHFLMLSLGFEGQYAGHADRQGPFGHLLERVERALKVPPVAAASFAKGKLTPQPYGMAAPPAAVRRGSPKALISTLLAVALLLPAASLFWAMQAPAIPAMKVAQDPRQPLQRLATSFDCSDVALQVEPGERPGVTLTGYVHSNEDREQLLRAAAQVPGVGEVTGRLEVHAWPFCEVLRIIKPYSPAALPGRKPITIDTANGQRRLYEDDNLELRAVLPEMSGFPSLIYVSATGAIQQIYPNTAGQARPRAAGFVLEQADILPPPSTFKVSCPFGEEMVVAILSPEPLFPVRSDQAVKTDVNLPDLRQALQQREAAGRGLFANHIFLTTVARNRTDGPEAACRPD